MITADQARELTEKNERQQIEDKEKLFKEVFDYIDDLVTQAANHRREVIIPFNGSKKYPHMKFWIKNLCMVNWDGGERVEISKDCVELVRRLRDMLGFDVKVYASDLKISW